MNYYGDDAYDFDLDEADEDVAPPPPPPPPSQNPRPAVGRVAAASHVQMSPRERRARSFLEDADSDNESLDGGPGGIESPPSIRRPSTAIAPGALAGARSTSTAAPTLQERVAARLAQLDAERSSMKSLNATSVSDGAGGGRDTPGSTGSGGGGSRPSAPASLNASRASAASAALERARSNIAARRGSSASRAGSSSPAVKAAANAGTTVFGSPLSPSDAALLAASPDSASDESSPEMSSSDFTTNAVAARAAAIQRVAASRERLQQQQQQHVAAAVAATPVSGPSVVSVGDEGDADSEYGDESFHDAEEEEDEEEAAGGANNMRSATVSPTLPSAPPPTASPTNGKSFAELALMMRDEAARMTSANFTVAPPLSSSSYSFSPAAAAAVPAASAAAPSVDTAAAATAARVPSAVQPVAAPVAITTPGDSTVPLTSLDPNALAGALLSLFSAGTGLAPLSAGDPASASAAAASALSGSLRAAASAALSRRLSAATGAQRALADLAESAAEERAAAEAAATAAYDDDAAAESAAAALSDDDVSLPPPPASVNRSHGVLLTAAGLEAAAIAAGFVIPPRMTRRPSSAPPAPPVAKGPPHRSTSASRVRSARVQADAEERRAARAAAAAAASVRRGASEPPSPRVLARAAAAVMPCFRKRDSPARTSANVSMIDPLAVASAARDAAISGGRARVAERLAALAVGGLAAAASSSLRRTPTRGIAVQQSERRGSRPLLAPPAVNREQHADSLYAGAALRADDADASISSRAERLAQTEREALIDAAEAAAARAATRLSEAQEAEAYARVREASAAAAAADLAASQRQAQSRIFESAAAAAHIASVAAAAATAAAASRSRPLLAPAAMSPSVHQQLTAASTWDERPALASARAKHDSAAAAAAAAASSTVAAAPPSPAQDELSEDEDAVDNSNDRSEDGGRAAPVLPPPAAPLSAVYAAAKGSKKRQQQSASMRRSAADRAAAARVMNENEPVKGVGLLVDDTTMRIEDRGSDSSSDDDDSLPPPPPPSAQNRSRDHSKRAPSRPRREDADAVIADAAAARYRAEAAAAAALAQVAELTARLARIESSGGAATVAAAVDGGRGSPFSALGVQVKNAMLDVVSFTPSPESPGGGARTATRLAREFLPQAPVSASTEIFADVAAAAAAVSAGAAAGGATALVPLPVATAALAQLAEAEKLVAAYETDNRRLRAASPSLDGEKHESEHGTATVGAERAELVAALGRIAELENELLAARSSGGGAGGANSSPPSPLQHHAVGGTGAGGAAATVSALLAEIDRMRAEAMRAADDARADMSRARDDARAREIELGAELDRARRAARDAESRAAGVDVSALAAESAELARVRAEAAADKRALSERLDAAEVKIAWYRENQAIVDKDAATRADQADTIRDLSARLRTAEAAVASRDARERLSIPFSRAGSSADNRKLAPSRENNAQNARGTPVSGKSAASSSPPFPESPPNLSPPPPYAGRPATVRGDADAAELSAALRRAAEAEAALLVANEALAKRHPDSLANLIREAKGSAHAAGEPAAAIAEIERLRAAGAAADETHDRALRALRQEFERAGAEWSARFARADAEAQTLRVRLAALGDAGDSGDVGSGEHHHDASVAAVSKRELALRARCKELETELERVRAFYSSKQAQSRGVSPAPGPGMVSRGVTPHPTLAVSSRGVSPMPMDSAGRSQGNTAASRSRGPSPAPRGESAASNNSRGPSPTPRGGVSSRGGPSPTASLPAHFESASRRASLASQSSPQASAGSPPVGGDSSPPRIDAVTVALTRAHAQVARLEDENATLRSLAALVAEAVEAARAGAEARAATSPDAVEALSRGTSPIPDAIGASYLAALEAENESLRAVAQLAAEAVGAARQRVAEEAQLAPLAPSPAAAQPPLPEAADTPPALARAQAQVSRLEKENMLLRSVAELAAEAVHAARDTAAGVEVPSSSPSPPPAARPSSESPSARLTRLEEENASLRAVAQLAAEAAAAARRSDASRASSTSQKSTLSSGSSRTASPFISQAAENVSPAIALLSGSIPLPTPLADSLRNGGGGVGSNAATLASVPPWAAAARARQEELCRTVDTLYGAVALLEARAEVREAELARAEAAAAAAGAAREKLLRAQYDAAAAVKDAALRAARDQVTALASALADRPTRPPGSSPAPVSELPRKQLPTGIASLARF
jgi:hypothetical protein